MLSVNPAAPPSDPPLVHAYPEIHPPWPRAAVRVQGCFLSRTSARGLWRSDGRFRAEHASWRLLLRRSTPGAHHKLAITSARLLSCSACEMTLTSSRALRVASFCATMAASSAAVGGEVPCITGTATQGTAAVSVSAAGVAEELNWSILLRLHLQLHTQQMAKIRPATRLPTASPIHEVSQSAASVGPIS